MTMTPRPLVQDLVKQAMANATQRAQISAEGSRQNQHAGAPPTEKTASSTTVSTDYALKLAAAIEYAGPSIVEMSKGAAPNMPPPHLTETPTSSPEGVSHSAVSGTMPGPSGQGKGHHQPPMTPGVQKAMAQEHGATQLENTIDHHVPGTQTTAMSGGQGKTASDALASKNLAVLAKLAGKTQEPAVKEPAAKEASVSAVEVLLQITKQAEDSINPASISAGAAVPPETSESGQPGGQPVGGAPQGPSSLVSSNASAIAYKKQQSHGPRKLELARYFSEPALSAATDKTLSQSFVHTPEAGVKISAAQLIKSASARALLAKLADEGTTQGS